MRDKNRIRPLLNKLENLWDKYPDLRFGQLISLITSEIKMPNLLLAEEADWEKAIEKVTHKTNKNTQSNIE
ncbi:hypothetical protein [Clostridium aciditolerans]|uniref:Uncharacterized protein n=1 Tax=Clostridium aciditolerans TaxID=339861 RepID=A0A934HYZ6_9CLOT|nr:hypothetical protein [Clostridium aciditolerans]MBI6874654.1 hypothetical protein [Clostridium aciditolerans]